MTRQAENFKAIVKYRNPIKIEYIILTGRSLAGARDDIVKVWF
jgi:hypothetical protein